MKHFYKFKEDAIKAGEYVQAASLPSKKEKKNRRQRQRMKNRYTNRFYGGFVIMDNRGIFYSAKRGYSK